LQTLNKPVVSNRQRKVRVALAPLRAFLSRVQAAVGKPEAEVAVCLVSDIEMARLNAAYRRKQGPTDVLSFPASKPSRKSHGAAVRFLGDIAIAPETARRYARLDGRPLREELQVLVLHGVLHLLGYDHETDQGQMDRLEQRLLRRLGLAS
jgi:probable rRNA maturation factor